MVPTAILNELMIFLSIGTIVQMLRQFSKRNVTMSVTMPFGIFNVECGQNGFLNPVHLSFAIENREQR